MAEATGTDPIDNGTADTSTDTTGDLADFGEQDLTSRARIRNAALQQFAAHGFAGTPLRAIAAEAGVAIGLISHHFGSKAGLRKALETWIVGLFEAAIDSADERTTGSVADAPARDAAVAQMLSDHPPVVAYLRRELLEPPEDRTLITRLSRASQKSVDAMRANGLASTSRDRVEQVVTVMVRQLGKLFMQPLVDQIVDSFPEDERPTGTPEISVEVNSTRPHD
ncbi:TetR/AcrR family transcriptional regulator [Brevibacterium spongiae]|uniref:TetR/AcrR family transcriptional regulator n=1 Tax=Brevibacterium spongiae TaxID=2909672 RepID=A0ABY5SQ95_9MICO|nr:TetR/AcrR family transcriptional regulator [Brevibacterium spongiae]UVI36718.1 TetR/AcrR family transcriptional regulator [Brevibacterium spongiae]